MSGVTEKRIRAVRRAILRWYGRSGRDLPWRKTREPYRVLISEMMLQQTQVLRVIPKYHQFLRSFPSLKTLSRATPGQVIAQWQGLGYNRRALWLHSTARTVVSDWNGRFPRSYEELRTLPGIGDYTARALLVFAFARQEAVMDVNVRRVLARITRRPLSSTSIETALSFLPSNRAYDWNQALMDIGAQYCTARRPACDQCPAKRHCLSADRVKPAPPAVKRTEPSRHGTPRRIYRGRILKELSKRTPLTARLLAPKVGLRTNDQDLAWLRSIIERLDKEGLVHLRSGRSTWSVRRVT